MFHIEFMQRALNLAKKGLGHVSPNPAVGCVIVKQGRIIGEGYHQYFGGPHAEINAIQNATEPVAGNDVYVTLEPCSHYGKTPPCVDRLIQEQVKRVFIAIKDPNPEINGRGIRKLIQAGIEVSVGHMEAEAEELNRFFIHFISTGRPYVILKAAITLDGFIADSTGNSKWISNSASRSEVHLLRSQVDAVLIGAGTVRTDNPKLNVRMVKGRNPQKIVLSNSGNLSPKSNVFTDRTILVTAPDALTDEKKMKFQGIGVQLLEDSGPVLTPLLKSFATMGLTSLLVEGGAGIFGAFTEQRLVDEFLIYVAPVILGDGIPLFRMRGRTMAEAIRLSGQDTRICLREL
ncbi:MAG: bifunctional diaminohydroxyphosphoribosylaminopyrimidine deaminase/5-amino-6-(5-phosphoribosylamino)uracil reductase RibD [Acidobacteria bacterium]|nr:bifunctional diaminohydroxyphosphoribosylaminopyrimidine deaminase/5-amino-6-(5-phosphoribosylamino)uracil reductase RibD [Acidobacteriota bacterium]